MIEVKMKITPFECEAVSEGHADYNPGRDPVCAAVSALMYTLIGACENLLEEYTENVFKGRIYVHHSTKSRKNARLAETIFTVVAIGLLQIQKTYPDYVRVTIE